MEVDREVAIQRHQKRNNLSIEECEKRLDCQWSNEKRESYADVVIQNNGTQEELKKEIEHYLHCNVCSTNSSNILLSVNQLVHKIE